MRRIDTIHIHCSASEYGSMELFREWHLDKGWSDIGYNIVILNPYKDSLSIKSKLPDFSRDGNIEYGRPIGTIPASIKGHNRGAIAICLVGVNIFTGKQFDALCVLVKNLSEVYPIKEIVGHYELDEKKTCPNIDMNYLRRLLKNNIILT